MMKSEIGQILLMKLVKNIQIMKFFIYTNGTIPPQDKQLEKFQGRKINFVITEYGKLSRNLENSKKKLNKFGITYVSTPAENWLDCSDLKKHNRATT